MPSKHLPIRAPRRALVACAGVLALATTPAAIASHQFTDVPDSNPFHTEIGTFKATNITTGCTATTFCPQDAVKRQAMAAFIDRALGLVIRPGESTYKAVPGSLASALDDDQSYVGTSFNALAYRGPGNNVVGGNYVNNIASGVVGATVAGGGEGGLPNRVTDNYSSVGGGYNNVAGNSAGPPYDTYGDTVAGGRENVASGVLATVGGGRSNTADGGYSAVAGGQYNTASGYSATVAGGELSTASGFDATVAGGDTNTASGIAATVAGGIGNTASGTSSTVAAGSYNTAAGSYSFAAGSNAKANHTGSFVWADGHTIDFPSLADYQFRVRATGGVGFVTAIDDAGNPSVSAFLSAGSGSWSSSSDRNVKRGFAAVDRRAVLRRLARVPITTWRYKSQRPSIRHIGPTAQDFRRAFRVGESAKAISMVDADGVALAAIQALYRQNQAQARKIARLERTVAALGRKVR